MLTTPPVSSSLEIRTVDGCEPAWRNYVADHPQATLYHRLDFKAVIESGFGHSCLYLMAWDGDTVQGVLPLVEMNSWLFGHFLVSLPYFNYGGILASSPEAALSLAAEAARRASGLGVRHVELRQPQALELPWISRDHKVAMVLPLSGDAGSSWNSLSSRLRGKIRKANRAGAVFSVAGVERLDDFYSVFARNMRDLGTPVYSRRFFDRVLRSLAGSADLFLVHLKEEPVAAAIGLRHGGTLELPWICSNYAHSANYVNEFLYWSVIEWASGRNLSWLDLGRSSAGSGPHRFKLQWNPEERPLSWYYWMPGGGAPAQLNPDNPKYATAIRLWRKLPLWLANRLGPPIVRNIP